MATSYDNNGGTGQRTAIVTVTYNGNVVSGSDHALVDGTKTYVAGVTFPTNFAVANEWIKFSFDIAVVIDEAKAWMESDYAEGTWKWQGSIDNFVSDINDIGSTFTLQSSSNTQTFTTLNGNTEAYKQYRMLGVSGNCYTSTNLMSEMEFKINTVSDVSYLNPLGFGDRSATITVTGSSGLLNGTTSIFVDGALTSGFYFNTVTLDGNQWIDFDFGADYVMTEAMFKESGAVGQGTWHWEGKVDGGGSYVTTGLGSTFTLGGGGIADDGAYTTTLTEPASNTNAYRYYRLVSNSGSTSNGPWVLEMMFKIGTPPAAPAAGLTINEVIADTVEGSAYASVDGVAV